MLQEAEDNYYITAKYLLELANRAYDLFVSSELEEKRQLIKLVLQNCELRGKNIDFTLKKPFDAILLANKSQDWLPNPKITIAIVEKILKAFENVIQTELIKVRWEQIKRFQAQPVLKITTT